MYTIARFKKSITIVYSLLPYFFETRLCNPSCYNVTAAFETQVDENLQSIACINVFT